MPDRLSSQPLATHVLAIAASEEKQWKITVSGAPSARSTSSTSASASRLWIISGLPVRLARSMCQANASRWVAGSAQPSSLPGQYMSMPVSPTATTRGCCSQPLDDGLGLVGERVGAGGVQRDGGINPRVGVGGFGDPASGLEIVGDGDDGLHADRLGPVDDRADALGVGGAAGVEVGVRVDQRCQRLRGRGLLPSGGRLSLTATQ